MKIILASASPRRKELLAQIGMQFLVIPAQGDEVGTQVVPADMVVELASNKAEEIFRQQVKTCTEKDFLVIGADTIVVDHDRVLGKPKDEADAADTLSSLSGKTHEVYTGVSLWIHKEGSDIVKSFYEKTEVTMYSMSEEEIRAYIKSGEPMDKAGSYGIQGLGARFVEKINGDYNNVVGLPIARICHELVQLSIDI